MRRGPVLAYRMTAMLSTLCLSKASGRKTPTLAQPSSRNDHVGEDVADLGLSAEHLRMVDEVFLSRRIQSEEFRRAAAASGWKLNRHQVYRYFAASQWSDRYNGKRIEDAVVDTVTWRRDFGIAQIRPEQIASIVEKGVAYVNGLDRNGRSIIYFKFGRAGRVESSETLLQALLYTVERADRLCEESQSGEFIAVIDFEGVTLRNLPPFKAIRLAIDLLKQHYPYRLGGIYIIKTGITFNIVWKIFRPLLPKPVLAKTFIVSESDREKILFAQVGEEFLESSYGGKANTPLNFRKYLQLG